MNELLDREDRDHIINMDETQWQVFPNGIMTWRDTGTDNVQVKINGNEKKGLTVLASITASGRKLPLLILAKGKTARCERSQLPVDLNGNERTHSESGWTTKTVMETYFKLLRKAYPPRRPGDNGPRLHLVLDLYAAHKMKEVKDMAKEMNIELHFIPPGMTDEYQPLDRRVFGCLKASGKAKFRQHYREDPSQKFNTKCATDCLLAAWDKLESEVIEEAWDIYGQ